MANTFTKIASVTVGSGGASSISFSSIPSTYTDLCLKISSRVNYSGYWVGIFGQFNGSSTGYSYVRLYGYGGSTVASDTAAAFGMSQGTASTANAFASSELYVPNYASSNYKSFAVDGVSEENGVNGLSLLSSGLWSNTSAITSITLTNDVSQNFLQYSTATLYGISKS
jgi:hypothetical protein